MLGRAGACRVLGSSGNLLWHRYEKTSPVVECKHYLQDHGISVGCRFSQNEIIQFQPFHVLLNASLGSRTLKILSKRMELQDLGMEGWGAHTLLCGAAAGGRSWAVGLQGCPIMSQLAFGPLGHGERHSLGISCALQ